MKNLPLLIGTILGSIVLIFGVGFLFSRTPDATTTVLDQTMLQTDLAHSKGATESAKVTVVEFSDFQCPACRAAEPVVAQLSQEFADSVQFGYRHFPLTSIHPNAYPAALAAEAAAMQNSFWPFHDKLFDKQDEWAAISDKEELETRFGEYAETLGFDREKFMTDMKSEEAASRVAADTAMGTEANVNSTPTFFVNGVPTPAAQLRASIESLLAAQ